jgi:uncharacterized protein YdaT
MASLASATSNVLDTVTSASGAVCNVINMVSKSATFGSNWMDSVLSKQSVALKIDNEIFKTTYVETRAMELATQRLAIEEWAERSPRTKTLYETSLVQLKSALETK